MLATGYGFVYGEFREAPKITTHKRPRLEHLEMTSSKLSTNQ